MLYSDIYICLFLSSGKLHYLVNEYIKESVGVTLIMEKIKEDRLRLFRHVIGRDNL